MKKYILITSLTITTMLSAANQLENNAVFHKELINCGKEGCSVVCHEPGNRWDSFLQSKGNIEVTYFYGSGVRQLKADMGQGQYTLLDTNPNYQSCRIEGIVN